jgi:cyclohexadienyl dehydratase
MTKWISVCGSFVGLVVLFVLLPQIIHARPLTAIKSGGTLRVGLTGDYAPYSLRGVDGKFAGADVTMAQNLAKSMGVALEIVPTAWRSLQSDLQADRFDIAMGGVSVTADRAAVGVFSVTVMRDGKRPIARCAEKERYNAVKAIDDPSVRVIVNPGGTNERFARSNLPNAHVEVFVDNRMIFEEIVSGRADVMVTDGAEVDYQARRHPGILCPAAVAESFDHFDKAFWMTRDPALKSAVDIWLTKSLAAGDYQKALAAAAAE